ncbi:hypothetical protein [Streptomyces sp. NRRL WC-3742]|uniref:hypothetical protein n=1 Tax=Streptomyces sp. NRRL WC-3742 TaxID=1463934 RepID=UPI00068A984F|nr:hypothetical protein [Streptomyces sp. NRRL WC-3742]
MGRESRLVGPAMPWALRLLLLAALVLGIATMHTLGHPSVAHGGHGEPMAPVAQSADGEGVAPAALPAAVVQERPVAPVALPPGGGFVRSLAAAHGRSMLSAVPPAAVVQERPVAPVALPPGGGFVRSLAAAHDWPMLSAVVAHDVRPAMPAHGMDPMVVCLAVLAGWSLVLLAVGPLLLRRSGDAAAAVRAQVLRAVRALPPPGGGRVLLNRLSVLRQ